MTRGSGETTRQMLQAPPNAVYVWPNGQLDYARVLARRLNRQDLRIVSPEYLASMCRIADERSSVVLDHAVVELDVLTPDQLRGLAILRTRPA